MAAAYRYEVSEEISIICISSLDLLIFAAAADSNMRMPACEATGAYSVSGLKSISSTCLSPRRKQCDFSKNSALMVLRDLSLNCYVKGI